MSNSTDALWRAWVQFIEDTIVTTGGWLVTADTGQMTISTSLHPTLANTIVGYRVYKMNDTLQATSPLFMKIEYGSGGVANTPRATFTLGTGTDGLGTVTGQLIFRGNLTASTNGTNACNSYGSADTGRLQLLMFVRAGADDIMAFSLERTKDATGADTSAGFLLTYGNAGPIVFTNYFNATPGAQPSGETGISFVLSNLSGSTSYAGDVGVGIPLHFKSVVQQPGLGMVIVNSADFAAEATPSFNFYGASHTYQLGNSATNQVAKTDGNNGFSNRATTRVGIRYE
jgi:hypothetical protein